MATDQNNADFDNLNRLTFNKSAGSLLFFASKCLQMAQGQYFMYDNTDKIALVTEIRTKLEELRTTNKAEWFAKQKS